MILLPAELQNSLNSCFYSEPLEDSGLVEEPVALEEVVLLCQIKLGEIFTIVRGDRQSYTVGCIGVG